MVVAGIFTEFNRSLLAFIRSKIKSKEDAEDILQNVYLKIHAHVNKLSDEQKLQGWIFTITRNAIIDYYRVNASNKNILAELEPPYYVLEEADSDSTMGLDQCMESMIMLLPEGYKNIIIDAELKGMKQKDLAKKYNMAYSSMRSRVQRGRDRLKQLFYNCCDIQTDSRGNVLQAVSRGNCNGPCRASGEACL